MTTFSSGSRRHADWLFTQTSPTANPWRFGVYLIPSENGQPLTIEATQSSLNQSSIVYLSSIPHSNSTDVMKQFTGRESRAPLTIPETIASGDYFLAIIADDEEQVGELEREDNITLSTVPLRIRGVDEAGPDFTICGLSVSTFQGIEAGQRPLLPLGEQISAELCIANPVIDQPSRAPMRST